MERDASSLPVYLLKSVLCVGVWKSKQRSPTPRPARQHRGGTRQCRAMRPTRPPWPAAAARCHAARREQRAAPSAGGGQLALAALAARPRRAARAARAETQRAATTSARTLRHRSRAVWRIGASVGASCANRAAHSVQESVCLGGM